jgi:hypothetical protein
MNRSSPTSWCFGRVARCVVSDKMMAMPGSLPASALRRLQLKGVRVRESSSGSHSQELKEEVIWVVGHSVQPIPLRTARRYWL